MIDTATEACSVALFEDNLLIACEHLVVGRGHAERLLPMIERLPEMGKAERIAVDVGPGSFTGVRIGIAAARALAFAWEAALVGYSALTMIAAATKGEAEASDDETIAVTITGGHGELFWQCFNSQTLRPLSELASTPISILAKQLRQRCVFGTGAPALVAARGCGEAISRYPNASDFLMLPPGSGNLPPRPLYGRSADARPLA